MVLLVFDDRSSNIYLDNLDCKLYLIIRVLSIQFSLNLEIILSNMSFICRMHFYLQLVINICSRKLICWKSSPIFKSDYVSYSFDLVGRNPCVILGLESNLLILANNVDKFIEDQSFWHKVPHIKLEGHQFGRFITKRSRLNVDNEGLSSVSNVR